MTQEGWVHFQVCAVVRLLSVNSLSSWALHSPPDFLLISFFTHSINKQNSTSSNSLSKFPSPFLLVCSCPVLSFPRSLLLILHISTSAIYLAHNLTSSPCTPSQSWVCFSHSLCAFLAPHSNCGPSLLYFFPLEMAKDILPFPVSYVRKSWATLTVGIATSNTYLYFI